MGNSRKYLVTGGMGFLGSNLTKRLVSLGHEVRVLDDMSRGKPERLQGISCEMISGDIRDERTVSDAAQGCDSILHFAYLQGTQTFYTSSKLVLDVAMRGMVNILSACERQGIGELLLVSSSEAYQVANTVPTPETVPLTVPDPLNPRYSYGGGKIACELMAVAWAREGILDRLIIARPHNIYGNDGGYEHVIPEMAIRIRRLLAEYPDEGPIPFPIQGTGLETRAFCHISDCVDAFTLLLGKLPDGQHVYHVGTPEEVTITELATRIGAHYDRELKVVPGSLPKGSPPRRCPDITKLRTLGYKPKILLDEGLGPVLDWYRENPK